MNPVFQDYLQTRGELAGTSLGCHRLWLSQFERYCASRELTWNTCRAQDLADFHQFLLWRPNRLGKLYSSNTVDQALRVVRGFYRWAHRGQLIAADPTSTWVLPRPPQPDQPTLSQAQLMQLLNLPDLSHPRGIRDQLLLELISWLSLSVTECRLLQLDQVAGEHLELGERRLELEPCKLALERYLSRSRPLLVTRPNSFLLLNNLGGAYRADASFQQLLRRYGQQLGLAHSLNASILHRSSRAQLEQLARRHSQPRP